MITFFPGEVYFSLHLSSVGDASVEVVQDRVEEMSALIAGEEDEQAVAEVPFWYYNLAEKDRRWSEKFCKTNSRSESVKLYTKQTVDSWFIEPMT